MKTLHIAKSNLAKWLALAVVPVVLLLAVIANVVAGAWGPENRATFTQAVPATYVTFNSITDNADQGDERDFVHAKIATDTNKNGWQDTVQVQPGTEYLVRIYVHNNAADNLNLVAKNTRAFAALPTTYATQATVTGEVRADNANPARVWDEVTFTGASKFRLVYINGSATYTNNVFTQGTKISDDIVKSGGALLGYDQLNGDIPGCFKYSGWVMFKVVAQSEPSSQFTLEKKVRKAGATGWNKSVEVSPGDEVEYLIGYKNIGNTVQNNVNIHDTLPKGINFVDGSVKLTNGNNKNGKQIAGNSLVNKGLDIGSYDTGANAYIQFKAKVGAANDLKCGMNSLRNYGHATVDGSTKQDYADVTVTVECQPNECKPGIPEGDPRCEAEPCVPAEGEIVDKNGNCVPAALPTTGPAQIIAGILGVALVTLGFAYWMRSRKSYKKALAGFTEDFNEEPKEHLLEARAERSHHHDGHADNFHSRLHR